MMNFGEHRCKRTAALEWEGLALTESGECGARVTRPDAPPAPAASPAPRPAGTFMITEDLVLLAVPDPS